MTHGISSFASLGVFLRIAIQAQAADASAILQLLSPWSFSVTDPETADVAVVYRRNRPIEARKTIVVPWNSADFLALAKNAMPHISKHLSKQVQADVNLDMVLTTTPEFVYSDTEPSQPASATIDIDENTFFLTLDVVEEYKRILDEALNAKPCVTYRFFTSLPIPYGLAPKQLRDFVMQAGREKVDYTLDKLPLDALRFILAKALEKAAGRKLERKTWNGRRVACLFTHDIDSCQGLEKSKQVKKLEEKYDVPSAWYLPSRKFLLDSETVRELGNHGEIGAHDTKHDGKLAYLSGQRLVERLCEAKQALQKVADCPVRGFRAPLLQHSFAILEGLKSAGYSYDTSVPTWEPKHPWTMSSHGLGTTYPMVLDGMVEIPVSQIQDHQLLNVLGLEPKDVITSWLSSMDLIKEMGGCCVFLSHPEYGLFDMHNSALYEELLNTIICDEEVWLTTPMQLVEEVRRQNAFGNIMVDRVGD